MGNKERGEVSVDVGGKSYTLRPTFDSLCELEELVGKPLHELLTGIEEGRISGLRSVVWCFLQDAHADEFKELKDASRWIEQLGGVDAVKGLIDRVLEINAPEQTAKGKRGPRKAQAGTGKRSSSALAATA